MIAKEMVVLTNTMKPKSIAYLPLHVVVEGRRSKVRRRVACVVRLEFVIERRRRRKEVPHPTPSFPHRDTQPLTAIQHPIRDYPVGVKQDEICNL